MEGGSVSKLGWLGVIAAFVLVGCSVPDPSMDEEVGESEDHLLAGRRLSPAEVASVLREAGFPEAAVGKMVCTAKYESSFYERASHRNTNGTTDYGLFQINSVHVGDTGCPSSATALYEAAANARCALKVYRSQGMGAWYAYRKHRSECDGYAAPAAEGGEAGPQEAGGCWSGTLGEMVDASACVQSKHNGVWFQCHEGEWYRGVSGSSGPYGACSSVHAL